MRGTSPGAKRISDVSRWQLSPRTLLLSVTDSYTTPPHLRPRELWRLDIPNEGVVQCSYSPVERAAVLKVNGVIQHVVQREGEEETLKVTELWKQVYAGCAILFSAPPGGAH